MLNYNEFILLVKTIQGQQKEIQELKNRIEILEEK